MSDWEEFTVILGLGGKERKEFALFVLLKRDEGGLRTSCGRWGGMGSWETWNKMGMVKSVW